MKDAAHDDAMAAGCLAETPQPDMPLIEAITSRRTVRRYQSQPVPFDDLARLLQLATHAPSACNRRGWRFIAIESREALEWFYTKGGSSVVRSAPQAVLVCYRDDTDNTAWRDVEQSAAAAIAYFQLLAHTRGIGSCWICHLPPPGEVAQRFHVPAPYRPIALLTVGYYEASLRLQPRRLEEAAPLCREQWSFPSEPAPPWLRAQLRRLARWLFFLFPKREWLRPHVEGFQRRFDNELPEEEA